MRALRPWMEMAMPRTDMARLFDRFLEPGWSDLPGLGEWEPKLDVMETNDAFVVKAEVPGVAPKDIDVSLRDGVLTMKGEKGEEKEENDKRYHRVERAYGGFARAIRLPAAVDAGRVTATFKDGVVTITLPKMPEAKGTTIPVKAA